MPKLNDMFPSKYLKAADCDDGDLTLTINHLDQEWVGQGEDRELKWVCYFDEQAKGLVLNKTNSCTIAKLHGSDTDEWEGKPVTLFSTEVQFGKDMVDSIRIRSKPPKSVRAGKPAKATNPPMTQAEADADDPIPF